MNLDAFSEEVLVYQKLLCLMQEKWGSGVGGGFEECVAC